MANRVSMEDIAKKLGITRNTISLALRCMPGINTETRKLILKTAREMGYEYNTREYVSNKNAKSICLMMPKSIRNSGSFYAGIQYGIETEARANNINTILHYFEETRGLETPLCVRDCAVSGILALGHMAREKLEIIAGYGVPTVVIDEYYHDLKLDYVLTDNLNGAFCAVEYLIKNGHSRICFSGDIKKASSFHERYLGMIKAMQHYGLNFDPQINKVNPDDISQDDSTAFIQALPFRPTAFFCCNDPEALRLYRLLSNAGIRIPEDISIIGFDDIESAANVTPSLTTIRVETEYMGKRAIAMLLDKPASLRNTPEKVLIPAQLVERNSVRPI